MIESDSRPSSPLRPEHAIVPTAPPRTGRTLSIEIGAAIRRHLNGDKTAMTDLVRRVRPWLYRIVLNHRLDHHSAEDVVQDTLLALLENLDRLRDPDAGLGWLSTVASRRAIRAITTARRDEPRGDRPETAELVAPDDPEQSVLDALTGALLASTVAKLPERHGQVLQLAFLADERDYATISRTLEMPVGSVGPTRQRALRKMRQMLTADPEWALDTSA